MTWNLLQLLLHDSNLHINRIYSVNGTLYHLRPHSFSIRVIDQSRPSYAAFFSSHRTFFFLPAGLYVDSGPNIETGRRELGRTRSLEGPGLSIAIPAPCGSTGKRRLAHLIDGLLTIGHTGIGAIGIRVHALARISNVSLSTSTPSEDDSGASQERHSLVQLELLPWNRGRGTS